MHVILWQTDIVAPWKRALDLKDLRFANGTLLLDVEEEAGTPWTLQFAPVQSWRVTAEECAGSIVSGLPPDGSLFIVESSEWIRQLGSATPLQNSRHFVICCYDEVVEVLAWNCSIAKGMAD
jgi:hypothetical protein